MTEIKTLRELNPFIDFAIDANEPLLLIGPTGSGKTELVIELGHSKGLKVEVLNLSVMEASDFSGMPMRKAGRSSNAPPDWLPDVDHDGPGILFIDEINRAHRELLNPLLQLITLRKINKYVFPADWRIVAAMNPDNADGYQVNELDPALLARFLQVEVIPDQAGWVEWADRQGQLDPAKCYHPAVLSFVASTPKIFESVRSSPRAWTSISKLLKAAEAVDLETKMIRKTVEAKVGRDLARAFMKVYAAGPQGVPPKAEQILKGTARVLEQVSAIAKSGDTAAVEGMVQQVLIYMQDPDRCTKVRSNPKAMAALRKFRDKLPAEFRERLDKRFPWMNKKGGTK